MRDLLDLINTMSDETSVELHDSFDIELSENFVIETGVVALTEDAIVIEGDDKTCELLEEHGLVLEKMIMGLPGDQGSKVMGEDGVAEGSENNNTTAQKIFFARSDKAPKGWSYDHVGFITQDGRQIQMSGHKGNDVYVTNDVTDDPEFPKQNIKIVTLSKPVSVPLTNSVGAENCGTFVANVLQANGIKGIDTQKIYSVFKKPQEQGVAEGVAEGEMDDGESYDENQPIEFYIALHDLDDNSLFIGAVSKYNGNWHESTVKGNPPYNWGSNYMSYLTPSDVWQHIRNDFRRGYELGGPFDTPDEAQEYADSHFAHSFEKNDDELNEAEYHGRKVSLGKPFLTPDGPKKRSVYVRKPNGKVVKVNFGDKKMRIKKSSPAHRKSFRARHNCANPGPRWKARYWSCRAW